MAFTVAVAFFGATSAAPATAYRPTAGVGVYLSGTSGGNIGTIANGYTPVPADPTTCDTSTSCTIGALGAAGSRSYGVFYYAFNATGIFNGTLKVYYDMTATDGGLSNTSDVYLEYSLDNGTTWVTWNTINSGLAGMVSYGPTEDDIVLANVNIALLQVRLVCTGSRIGVSPNYDSASSDGSIYDVVFVPSGSGASYTVGYRPNTSTNVGTAPTNQANAYDTGTATTIDSSTFSNKVNTTTTATTQVYSGMTNVTGKNGWLIVKVDTTIGSVVGNVTVTYDLAGSASPAQLFSTGVGGTSTTGRATATAVGSTSWTLYKYVTNQNPSLLRVKVSETAGSGGTATANVYDVVFLAIN